MKFFAPVLCIVFVLCVNVCFAVESEPIDPNCTQKMVNGTLHQVIYPKDGSGREIMLSRSFEEGAKSLLGRVVYGTTGPRYRHVDGYYKAGNGAGTPYLFTYTVHGIVAGTFALYRKNVWIAGRYVDVFYRTSLAIEPSVQGRGHGSFFTKKVYDYALDLIRDEGFLYGYVESDNARSMAMARANDAQSVGEFSVYMYQPSGSTIEYAIARDSDRVTIINLLKSKQGGLEMKDFAISVSPKDYYLVRNNRGEIVAGVQVVPHHWTFEKLPAGPLGWLVLKTFPYLPYVRSHVLNPKDHQFLQFGNFYWAPGEERTLLRLMNALVSRYHVPSGLISIDERSDAYRMFTNLDAFTAFSRAMKATAQVMIRSKNLSPETKAALKAGPLHISLGDQ